MSTWAYPINGEMRYFAKSGDQVGFSASGVLRSMALYIDKLPDSSSVEAMFTYSESDREGWAGILAIYHDRPANENKDAA